MPEETQTAIAATEVTNLPPPAPPAPVDIIDITPPYPLGTLVLYRRPQHDSEGADPVPAMVNAHTRDKNTGLLTGEFSLFILHFDGQFLERTAFPQNVVEVLYQPGMLAPQSKSRDTKASQAESASLALISDQLKGITARLDEVENQMGIDPAPVPVTPAAPPPPALTKAKK